MDDPTQSAYNFTTVGSYNPLASTVLNLPNFAWPGGAADPPGDLFSEDWDCPFPDNEVTESKFGIMIGAILCCTVLLVLVVVTAIIWK
jgi:hypothetical protein